MSDQQDKSAQDADNDPISLEQLSDAFAEMMDSQEPLSADEASAGEDGNSPGLLDLSNSTSDDPVAITPTSILEALLFVGHPENKAITRQQIASVIKEVRGEEVEELVEQLNEQLSQRDYCYEVVSDGDGFRLALREELGRMRDVFYGRIRRSRLSQAAIEVLSLVAYQQPVTSEKVGRLRGKPSGPILAQLVRRQLVQMQRPTEKPRTPLYSTTDRFLKLFGLDSLDELPRSESTEA